MTAVVAVLRSPLAQQVFGSESDGCQRKFLEMDFGVWKFVVVV